MSKRLSATEAKTRLGGLLEDVAALGHRHDGAGERMTESFDAGKTFAQRTRDELGSDEVRASGLIGFVFPLSRLADLAVFA